MNNRTTMTMTIAVLTGFAVILLMNMASFFGIEASKYVSPNAIRGSAVEHKGVLYTLNFDQQNRLIELINHSIPITQAMIDKRRANHAAPLEIQHVVLYRFNEPNLVLRPLGFVNRLNSALSYSPENSLMMVYSITGLATPELLEESSPGEFKNLFSETYDQ